MYGIFILKNKILVFMNEETLAKTILKSKLPVNLYITQIPKMRPKSPTRFTRNAFIAAAFALCFLNQKPMSK